MEENKMKEDRSLDLAFNKIRLIHDKSWKVHGIMSDFYDLTFPCPKNAAQADTETETVMEKIILYLNDICELLEDAIDIGTNAYKQLKKENE